MKILIVGSGKGSWIMRGQQLGAALGARVVSEPKEADWQWADVAILIKRSGLTYAHHAHAARVPIVWDALDFWRQPSNNAFGEMGAMDTLRWHRDQIKPAVCIGATQAMADALGGIYLPHHSWAGLEPTDARETVQTVAYEGNATYLGQWQTRLEQACAKRGWAFVVNPRDLRDVDILVGFRDGAWDGYMCREWKSGVKVVNAVAAGRPFIGQQSAALREIQPPHTIVEQPFGGVLDAALDAWAPYAARAAAVDVCLQLAPAYKLHTIAESYRQVLERTVEASRCAA